MTYLTPAPEVLGRLLALPNVLAVLQDHLAIAQFLRAALQEVPGIDDVIFCLEGVIHPNHHPSCQNCPAPIQFPVPLGKAAPVCPLITTDSGRSVITKQQLQLKTYHHYYGYLTLFLSDLEQFNLYSPYIFNITNITAMIIENQQFIHELKAKNKSLEELLENLEQRVEDRTRDLTEEIKKRNILEIQLFDSQTQLSESHAQLMQAQLIAGMGDFIWDIDTGEVVWSEGLYHLLKYNQDEAITYEFVNQKVHYPEDLEIINNWLTAAANSTQQIPPGEYRLIRKDGVVIHVQINGRIQRRAGQTRKLLGTCLDITVRKNFEEKLQRYQRIVSVTKDLMALIDRNYTYQLINEAYAHAFLKEEREIIGHPVSELISAELFETSLQEKIDRCFLGEVVSFQVWIEQAEQRQRFYDVVYTPYLGQTGEIEGVLVSGRDMTELRLAQEAQQRSEERWRALVENSPDYIMTVDRDYRVSCLNRLMTDFLPTVSLGVSLLDCIRESRQHIDPECVTQCAELLERVFRTGDAESYESTFETNGQGEQCFESRVVLIENPQGEKELLITTTNITARKQSAAKQQLLASVFSHAREGILLTDAQARIVDVNQAFTELTGYGREEILGQNPRFLKSGVHEEVFYQQMWRDLLDVGYWKGEIWNRRKDGAVYAEILTISEIKDDRGQVQYYVALFADITAQKRHQQQLEQIAHYDALTSLPNRLLLGDRLNESMLLAATQQRRLAVVYLDLDGFKTINDTYGHDVGDQLLKTIAKRMKHSLRRDDTIARLGGDEFVAVLMDVEDLATGKVIFDRLLQAAAQPIQLGDLLLQVSASLGITFYPQGEDVDADQLLRQADQAMYQAKVTGKNHYHLFDMEQDRYIRVYHRSLAAIRQAIANEEFVLHYQPKVNMRTGQIVGAEALIRWQHPQEGLLPPAQFLPIIENHPLSIQLGEWVITTALQQIDHWHGQDLKIPISVNISAMQLQSEHFAENLQRLLAEYPHIDPKYLELEILETSALEEIAQVSEVMQKCRQLGIHFALDDFGTGYSSLNYLKHLPARQLKIDQSFVYDMIKNPEDILILRSILTLAAALHRQVIAEGVETLAHGQILLKLGCELGQGYSIAKPMTAQHFLTWSETWQPNPLWQDQGSFNYNDFPLFLAVVEEETWFQSLRDYLEGQREQLDPLPQGDRCSFCQWFESQSQQMNGNSSKLQQLRLEHQNIHCLAQHILMLHQQRQTQAADDSLTQLTALRETLQLKLQSLSQARDLQNVEHRLQEQGWHSGWADRVV